MNITDFGFFHVIEPPPGNRILMFENEHGQDWYEMRAHLTHWDATGEFVDAILPTWAMVDADGVVTNVEYDPSRLMPGDRRILGIDAPIDEVRPGMVYRDGSLAQPETS